MNYQPETASKLPTFSENNGGLAIYNRVKLKADIQTPHKGQLITIYHNESMGTITASTPELVKIKLDFPPQIEGQPYDPSPFYIEVFADQIELIDPRVIIDPRFKTFITPLSDYELMKLDHNLSFYNCREPLVVWKEKNILLDGHHRFELCTMRGIPYSIEYVKCRSWEDAFNWIINNQLGRRNLTPEAISYLRGKLYNIQKQQGTRTDLTSGQSDQKLNQENLTFGQSDQKLEKEIAQETAQRLAQQYRVGEKTIRRDGKFAEAVDTLVSTLGDEVRQGILSRDANLNKKKTLELAAIATKQPQEIIEQFADGRYTPKLTLKAFPYEEGDVVKILSKNEPQLRGFGGCWGIITKKYNYSADLVMWNGTAQNIHPQYMQPLNYNSSQRQEKQQLQQRIEAIVAQAPEVIAMQVLSLFGKKTSGELTSLEEKMLTLFEEEYGIKTVNNEQLPVTNEHSSVISHQLSVTSNNEVLNNKKKSVETFNETSINTDNQSAINDEEKLITENSPQPSDLKYPESHTAINIDPNDPDYEPIIDLSKLPNNQNTMFGLDPDFPHHFVNDRNELFNYLPLGTYDRYDLIDLINIHTNRKGLTNQHIEQFLKDIYGYSTWSQMSDDELLHCLQVVRCVDYFYRVEDYETICDNFRIGDQVVWNHICYEISGFAYDWSRVFLKGIYPQNLGKIYYAHPAEIELFT